MLKKFNPLRYGFLGWIWKCYLSPVAWLFAMAGYTAPEDIPLRQSDECWEVLLAPNFKHPHRDILRTGNKIYGYFGADKAYVAEGLAQWVTHMNNEDPWSAFRTFSLEVPNDIYDEFIAEVKGMKEWIIKHDEQADYRHVQRSVANAKRKLEWMDERRNAAAASLLTHKEDCKVEAVLDDDY